VKDEDMFPLMQEAFSMKLRDPVKRTDEKIAKWLNKR